MNAKILEMERNIKSANSKISTLEDKCSKLEKENRYKFS